MSGAATRCVLKRVVNSAAHTMAPIVNMTYERRAHAPAMNSNAQKMIHGRIQSVASGVGSNTASTMRWKPDSGFAFAIDCGPTPHPRYQTHAAPKIKRKIATASADASGTRAATPRDHARRGTAATECGEVSNAARAARGGCRSTGRPTADRANTPSASAPSDTNACDSHSRKLPAHGGPGPRYAGRVAAAAGRNVIRLISCVSSTAGSRTMARMLWRDTSVSR